MWPWEEGAAWAHAFPRPHHWLLAALLIFGATQVMPIVAGLL
ncbi:hypothetical protein [Sphingobium cloacae]|nr:hypothetical protein [Sphingobium cloacae]